MRILLIEDNARLADLMRAGMEKQGFAVDLCATLDDAEYALELNSYHLLLVDLGLPDGDALDLIRRRRANADATPILVLTARSGLDDRVTGLDAGADDYLVKPFDIAELAARSRALLRRPGAVLDTVLTAGNVQLDPAHRTVGVDGRRVEASRREVALLENLMRRSGAVVAKRALDTALYAMDAEVTPNAVEAIVSRLRRRLANAAANVEIKTIHGIGYALMPPRSDDG